MQFINPLLWTWPLIGLLIALPIIIHLINLMRYRRVKWAAMEFLLAAHKKKSTWILLKQLLLLLMRIGALLILLLILAQMLYNADLSNLLSGVTTHHIVLVDNTYSTTDTSVGEDTPLEAAKKAAIAIGERAIASPGRHEFTLLAYSDAKGKNFLLNKRTVDREKFLETLRSVVNGIQATEFSIPPQAALEAVRALDRPENEKRHIYILSDYRHRDWGSPDDLNAQFQEMSDAGTAINLVQCARVEHENLSISSLKPRAGALAAGIAVVLDVAVTNHGTTAKNNVTIVRLVDGNTLAPITIPRIAPGKTETRSFEVEFDRPGMHRVTAQLQTEDAVAADNQRHTSLEANEGIPVLIVDGLLAAGETRGTDSFFIAQALKPGPFHTGISPEIQPPQFLSNPKANLRKYQGIFLCNFDRLSDQAIEALEKYVEAGGGLAIFLGEQTNPRYITQRLYAEGQGLFPAPLAAAIDLIEDRVEIAPAIDPDVDHPVFRVYGGLGGKFLSEIKLWRYYALARDWQPNEKSTVKVVARLRNQAPLAVEHQFRNGGKVIAFLTSAGPLWNDWARHMTYLVGMQELRHYLAPPFSDPSRPVGSELSEKLVPDEFDAGYLWRSAHWEEKGEMKFDSEGNYIFPLPKMAGGTISKSGIYDLNLTTREQKVVTKTFVLNVDPGEGNLKLVGGEGLRKLYDAPSVQVLQPGALSGQINDAVHSNLSEMLLYGLILLLVCEQMLAYSASYHPASLKEVA